VSFFSTNNFHVASDAPRTVSWRRHCLICRMGDRKSIRTKSV